MFNTTLLIHEGNLIVDKYNNRQEIGICTDRHVHVFDYDGLMVQFCVCLFCFLYKFKTGWSIFMFAIKSGICYFCLF